MGLGKTQTLHEVSEEGLLVCLELLFSAGLTNDHSARQLLRVRNELEKVVAHRHRNPRRVVSDFVGSTNEITRLLKLNRQKECRGHVDASNLTTLHIATTGSNLIGPERQATRI